jgi:hypothetical protein
MTKIWRMAMPIWKRQGKLSRSLEATLHPALHFRRLLSLRPRSPLSNTTVNSRTGALQARRLARSCRRSSWRTQPLSTIMVAPWWEVGPPKLLQIPSSIPRRRSTMKKLQNHPPSDKHLPTSRSSIPSRTDPVRDASVFRMSSVLRAAMTINNNRRVKNNSRLRHEDELKRKEALILLLEEEEEGYDDFLGDAGRCVTLQAGRASNQHLEDCK